MADFESLLNRWQTAGVLDAEAAARIRAWESEQKRPAGLRWQGMVALILGAILLACGVVLFVSAHWDQIGPGRALCCWSSPWWPSSTWPGPARARAFTASPPRCTPWAPSRPARPSRWWARSSTSRSTGRRRCCCGRSPRWPAGFCSATRRSRSLTLLLFPAWMLSELSFAARRPHRRGRLLWPVPVRLGGALSHVLSRLASARSVQGILFAAAAIAAVVGIVLLLGGWRRGRRARPICPSGPASGAGSSSPRCRCFFALFRLRKSLVPRGRGLVFSIALPWCHRTWIEHYELRQPSQHLHPARAQPCRPRAGGGLRRLHHLVGRAAGQQARWSTWASWALPSRWAGSTSATSSTRWAARWA